MKKILFILLCIFLTGCTTKEKEVETKKKTDDELIEEQMKKFEENKTSKKEEDSAGFNIREVFNNLNLSDLQIDSIVEILENVGATNFTLLKHNYTNASNELCLFRGTFNNAKNLQINITMENGTIFNVEISGLPKDGSYWNGNGDAVKLYYEGNYLNYYNQSENKIVNYSEK